MPPQTQDFEFRWEDYAKTLEVKKARRMDKLSDRAFLHQWTELHPREQRLTWPDPETGKWVSVSAYTGSDLREGRKWRAEDLSLASLKSFSMAGLRFRVEEEGLTRLSLQDPRRPSKNVWSMELKGQEFTWRSDGVHYFSAIDWPSHIVYLLNPRSFSTVDRWKWDEESRLADVLMCPGREQIFVENVPSAGLTRVVGFKDLKPKWFTVFDFSQGRQSSLASQVLSRNCRTLYFMTSDGIFSVEY